MGVSARRMSLLLVLVAIVGGCVKIGSLPANSSLVEPSGNPVPTATAASTGPAATATPRPTIAPRPTATTTASASPAPTATPDDGSQVIEVTLSDSLTIDPRKMSVTVGVPVRFVVTNDGALDHTFFIGSDKEQKVREAGTGEPGKDRFIAVPPGETVELDYTFDQPGKTIAGCTIAGHYSGGMKASITITAP
jgi:uncharacterized cupredoxin-like copper-binding protein